MPENALKKIFGSKRTFITATLLGNKYTLENRHNQFDFYRSPDWIKSDCICSIWKLSHRTASDNNYSICRSWRFLLFFLRHNRNVNQTEIQYLWSKEMETGLWRNIFQLHPQIRVHWCLSLLAPWTISKTAFLVGFSKWWHQTDHSALQAACRCSQMRVKSTKGKSRRTPKGCFADSQEASTPNDWCLPLSIIKFSFKEYLMFLLWVVLASSNLYPIWLGCLLQQWYPFLYNTHLQWQVYLGTRL